MKDPKKDAMVSKGGKVKVIDKDKEKDHLKKGYVRAEMNDVPKTMKRPPMPSKRTYMKGPKPAGRMKTRIG